MNCPNCNNVLAPGASFCASCGNKVTPEAHTASSMPAPTAPTPVPTPNAAPAPVAAQPPPPYVVAQSEGKGGGFAITSLVLGLLSLPGILFSILNVPLCIVGIVMGFLGWKSPKAGLAKAGLVLSILGLIGSVVFFISLASTLKNSPQNTPPSVEFSESTNR